MNPAPPGRVAGWDVLRGLCALTVACYHLLMWLELAELPALGTYGVYLFFVLSGASMAYTYGNVPMVTPREALRFLATRWLRLAPLFLVACIVFVAMLTIRNGALVDRLPLRMLLNATFAFGLHDPLVWSLPIGGWSLGVEFVFYLAFPVLLQAARRPKLAAAVFLALAVRQWSLVDGTIGTSGWDEGVVRYHQASSFAAYFFGGCLIGLHRLRRPGEWPLAAGVLGWAAMGLLLAVCMPDAPGEELLGWRGAVLFTACFAVVAVSGRARIPPGAWSRVAMWLGDITYGTYLLHPLIVFTVIWFVLPRFTSSAIGELAVAARAGISVGILALACVLAWVSERSFERPLRRWGKSLRMSRPAPRHAA